MSIIADIILLDGRPVEKQLIVMPDLRNLSRHGLSRGHPEVSTPLSPGFRLVDRNDKSLCDNIKFASPEGEGFPPSPAGLLK